MCMGDSRQEKNDIREVPLGSALPLPKPSAPLDPDDPAALLFTGPIPSTDDSPTVQSKAPPRQVAVPDETLAKSFQGKMLAHFELVDAIGKGGMATVLKARDTQLDRLVALKILPPEMASEPENILRFHQEAKSAARLDHENIARVYYCGEDQKLHFIAFEFIDGKNLRVIQETRRSLPFDQVLNWMIQVARGLNHASARGVIHRDIKPSNIIITPEGTAKIVDMGLARTLGPSEGGLTQSGMTLGTFDYISPEQALEPRDADHRSDIYSLGCTFYHLITGHPPVPEGTAARKLYHHQHVKPTDPRVLVPELPEQIILLLDKMMAKNPADRFQTMQEMLDAMLAVGNELGVVQERPRFSRTFRISRGWQPRHTITLSCLLMILLFVFVPGAGPEKTNPSTQWPILTVQEPLTRETTTPEPPVPSMRDPIPKNLPENKTTTIARYDSEDPTLDDLQEWLARNRQAQELEITLSKDLDLSRTGLNQANSIDIYSKQVTIRGKDPNHRPTIKLRYDSRVLNGPWVALHIESEIATIQDVNFLVDGSLAESELHALTFRGGKNLTLKRCEFIQAQASRGDGKKLVSLVVEPSTTLRPNLQVEACVFLGYAEIAPVSDSQNKNEPLSFKRPENAGNIAILRKGNSTIQLKDCAFSPHHSMVWFEGRTSESSKVSLQNCSILMGRNSALGTFADAAEGLLELRHSVVSTVPPRDEIGEENNATLIRQTDSNSRIRFVGEDNRYFKIGSYLQTASTAANIREYTAFSKNLQQRKMGTDDSRILEFLPWKESDPWKLLEENKIAQAFAIKDNQRDLRKQDAIASRMLGAEHCLEESYISRPLPALENLPVENRIRMVDPSANENSENIFKSIDMALAQLRNGDVIQIKHDGEVVLQPTKMEKLSGEVIIRPAPGFKPILVAGPPQESGQYPLFELTEGTLKLEDLEIHLRPNETRERTPTLAVLRKNSSIQLRSCNIQLEKGSSRNPPSLISIGTSTELMAMDASTPKPPAGTSNILIDRCKIRGECNLFRNRTNRIADLQITDSYLALVGVMAYLDPPAESSPQAGNFQLKLHHTSVATGGPCMLFKGIKPLTTPLGIRLQESILASAQGMPFMRFEGGEITEAKIPDMVRIDSVQNIFCAPASLMEWPEGGDTNLKTMNWTSWQENYQDSQSNNYDALTVFTNRESFWKSPWSQFKIASSPDIGPKSAE